MQRKGKGNGLVLLDHIKILVILIILRKFSILVKFSSGNNFRSERQTQSAARSSGRLLLAPRSAPPHCPPHTCPHGRQGWETVKGSLAGISPAFSHYRPSSTPRSGAGPPGALEDALGVHSGAVRMAPGTARWGHTSCVSGSLCGACCLHEAESRTPRRSQVQPVWGLGSRSASAWVTLTHREKLSNVESEVHRRFYRLCSNHSHRLELGPTKHFFPGGIFITDIV